jgi:hypothetical protein
VLGKEEIALAGFSKCEDRLAIYMMVFDDRYAARGWQPYTFNEIADGSRPRRSHHPEHVCPAAGEFEGRTHGRALMEAQRLTPGHGDLIGNYIQESTVTSEGVSARIVHRWRNKDAAIKGVNS